MKYGIGIFLIAFCLVGHSAQAKGKSSSGGKDSGIGELFLFQDSGKFEFESEVDKGNYDAFGLGFRAGYNSSYFFVGGEATYSAPSYTKEKNLSAADREAHFLADEYATNFGGTAAVKLGPVSIFGTYYFDSRLNGTVKNNVLSLPDANYQYHGSGVRFGIEIELAKGLALGAAIFSNTYGRYSVNKDINTLTKVSEEERSKLSISGSSVSLNYRIGIGG